MEKVMEKAFHAKQWIQKRRSGQWMLVVGCIAALILIYIVFSPGGGDSASSADNASEDTQDNTVSSVEMEKRLEEILSCIEGAGEVRVMITFATGTQIVPAMNVETQSNVSEQSDENGSWEKTTQESQQSAPAAVQGDETLVLVEKMPEILGVMVVAEGAGDLSVRLALQQAVETVLQVPAKKVDVFPMEKSEGG